MDARPVMRAAPTARFAPSIEQVTDGSHVPPAEVVQRLVQGGEVAEEAVRKVSAAIAVGAVAVSEPVGLTGPESDRRYPRLLAVFEVGRLGATWEVGRPRPVGADDVHDLIALWREDGEYRLHRQGFSFLTNLLSRLPPTHMAGMTDAIHRVRMLGERMVDGRDVTLAVLNRVAGRVVIHPDEGFPQFDDPRLGTVRAATLEVLAGRYQASRAAERAR